MGESRTYLALLRGINVGGKNKVEMTQLKSAFEACGLTDVQTYISTGNVLFSEEGRSPEELAPILEEAVRERFGVDSPILIRDLETIRSVAETIPSAWANDSTMKCDVLFLWDELDHPDIVEQLPVKQGIDTVIYSPGAVIWQVDRSNVNRSGLLRIVGTDMYRSITVRNCNTVRKLADLMAAGAD